MLIVSIILYRTIIIRVKISARIKRIKRKGMLNKIVEIRIIMTIIRRSIVIKIYIKIVLRKKLKKRKS